METQGFSLQEQDIADTSVYPQISSPYLRCIKLYWEKVNCMLRMLHLADYMWTRMRGFGCIYANFKLHSFILG